MSETKAVEGVPTDEATVNDASAPPPPPSKIVSLWEAARGWLQGIDVDELTVIVSLLALCVLVRCLHLTQIDIYWDAGAKWQFARQWSFENDFSQAKWSHHMARFGVNVPAFFVQKVFGATTTTYYILPVAMHTLQALCVYMIARRLHGRVAGVIGVLFMTFFSGMTRNASQLLPDGIAGSTALLAGYFFLRFHEADGRARRRWLVASAFACIWTYAIKESAVLIFPGFGVAVLLSRRSFKEASLFTGLIAGYALLETAGFRIFTLYPHRLAIVEEEHGFYPPMTFWELFDRFGKLDPPWQMLFWLWVASLVFDLGSSDKRRRLLALLPLGYVLVLTFMVRRVNPIQPWLSFKPRYMTPAAGFFVTAVAVFLGESLRRAWELIEWPKLRAWSQDVATHAGNYTLGLCVVLGAGAYQAARPDLPHHPIAMQRRDAKILNDAYRRNLPIVEDDYKNARGLKTIYAVFLQAKYLAQSTLAKPGWLPDTRDSVLVSKRGNKLAYLLRDDAAYGKGDLDRYVEDGCAVVVTAKGRVVISATSKLPEHCKAPRGEVIPP